jgi:serine protease AprX
MDLARSPLVAARRPGPVLALAVAAVTALSVLSPVALSPAAAAPAPADSPLVRVVVTSATDGLASVTAAVTAAGGTVLDALPLIGGVAADLPQDAVLAPSYVVAQDRPMSVAQTATAPGAALSTVRETIGAASPSDQGRGITVAVVDTGVADVPDLAGRVRHLDVSGEGPGDGYGHGTFVAGLIAGDGTSSQGAYAGVAPGADVLDVRVARADGTSSLSLVLRGLQAVANDPTVDVVNLSLSSGSPLPYQLDPLTRALEVLWTRGVVVVVPAGNEGADGITSPGVDPLLLTVGGLTEGGTAARGDDVVSPWSSVGPAAQGVAKPELVAPGKSLISTVAPGSVTEAAQTRTDVPAGYAAGSGSSFSTAVTSGAAAVLLEQRDLEPTQLKELLVGTAYGAAGLGDVNAAGAGGLDLAAALAAPTPVLAPRLQPVAGPPGQEKRWAAFLNDVFSHDVQAAEQTWSKLPDKHQEWATSLWADSDADVKRRAAAVWTALGWSAADGEPSVWQARIWAASNWAASNWGASNWGASNWGASNWGASNWGASNWGASNWGASNWGASNWGASNWGAVVWAASNWAASNWGASNWGASNWGASSWGASNWGASNWGASNWGASNWGASNWGASNWGASNWGASNWGASNWGASSWGASSWGASSWGSSTWS